jgi:replicative DNA helicase
MEEALIKRVMPHNIEAEHSVIGSMLMDKEAIMIASEIITGDDFYQKQCGILFSNMVELFNEGKAVDLVTLQNRLKENGVPEEVSNMGFVREILTNIPTSANVKYYADIVYEKAVLRKLIKTNEQIVNDCYVGADKLENILESTEKKIFDIVQRRNTGDYIPINKIVQNSIMRVSAASKLKGNVTGIPTGFIDLDYRTSGMQKSDLVLVAARPSMGKTAFVLNMAQYMAFECNKTVAIFSLEMSSEQLVNRLLAMEARIDAQKLRNGSLEDQDWESLLESAGTVAKSNLIIDDRASSLAEIRSKCRKFKLEHNLDIVIIDYLQLMSSGGGRSSDSRQQEISDISRGLKRMARELDVPVVALSQLSRAVEQRPDHRPMLSDLRESGAIEQDADVVMFLYRDEYYNKESELKGTAEVIIAKQRNGPIGTVTLAWLPQYTKFANIKK